MTVSFTFLWRFLWCSTFEHLIEDKVSISTVTGWLTQQDTCFTCISYFKFWTPSFLPWPDDAKVCLWCLPLILSAGMLVKSCPLFFCVFVLPLQPVLPMFCSSCLIWLSFPPDCESWIGTVLQLWTERSVYKHLLVSEIALESFIGSVLLPSVMTVCADCCLAVLACLKVKNYVRVSLWWCR